MKAVWFGLMLSAISAAGKVTHGKQGQKVTLKCGPRAFKDSIAWYHGEKLIIRERSKGPPLRGDSEVLHRAALRRGTDLEISRLQATDAGHFKCEIDSKGNQHVLLVYSASVAPSGTLRAGEQAELRCSVAGPAPGVTVQWKRPDGRPLAAGSQTVSLAPAALSDAGKWACTFTYDGTEYNETVDVTVKEPITSTTPHPGQNPGIRNSPCANCNSDLSSSDEELPGPSWWVWAIVGVGGLVVVALLVSIIVLARKVRRRKRRFLKMKQTRQMAPRQYCQCRRPAAAAKPQQGRRREKPPALPMQPLLME